MNTVALDNSVFWDLDCFEESLLQPSTFLFLNITRTPQVEFTGTVLLSSSAAVSAVGGEHKGQEEEVPCFKAIPGGVF